MPWELRYYTDSRGREPCRDWIDALILDRRQTAKGLAALAALDLVLARLGIDVCETEWGRNLGGGLYEFRVRHTKPEIDRMFDEAGVEGSPDPSRGRGKERVLLRIFFHAYGERIILLLAGFDKGRYPKKQDAEIARARKLLDDFRASRGKG
ncbi:MAG: hypothetical protein LBJ87_12680 [bacterium]|nr:hypothetical protein [bacterium]